MKKRIESLANQMYSAIEIRLVKMKAFTVHYRNVVKAKSDRQLVNHVNAYDAHEMTYDPRFFRLDIHFIFA